MVKGIYCIENLNNGKRYVGSSNNLKKRKKSHFYELKRGNHGNLKLQRSYNKHGEEKFTFYILEEVENELDLISREQFYIDNLKPQYNICKIADSSLGVKRSNETKEKIRQANLGLKHPEWRNKIKSESQGGENHWSKNKIFSDESKKKMSESHKKLYENGYKNPNSKKILQYSLNNEFIREWDSCYEAARHYECNEMAIRHNVKGRTKTSKGFIWKIKEN